MMAALQELPSRSINAVKKTARVGSLPVVLFLASLPGCGGNDAVTKSTKFPSCEVDPRPKREQIDIGFFDGKEHVALIEGVVFEVPKNAYPLRTDVVSVPDDRHISFGTDGSVGFPSPRDGRWYTVEEGRFLLDKDTSAIILSVNGMCGKG